MGEPTMPSRTVVVDAILAAFHHSRLPEAVDRDTFRTVLEMECGDMLTAEGLELQDLWDFLEQQPAFDKDVASPFICAIKGWESRFAHPVRLPQPLTGLTIQQVEHTARTVSVPEARLITIFDASEGEDRSPAAKRLTQNEKRTQRQKRASDAIEYIPSGQAASGADTRRVRWRDRGVVGVVAAGIGALCIGFVLIRMLGGGGFEPFTIADYTDVPLTKGQRLGSQVSATLVGTSWLDVPKETRRDELQQALQALHIESVDVFAILDDQGEVRATAQWQGEPPTILVKFW